MPLTVFLLTALMLSACGNVNAKANDNVLAQSVNTSVSAPRGDAEAKGQSNATELKEEGDDSSDKPAVYMTSDITAEGLQAVYNALEWTPAGSLAVKVTTGEPPDSNYLRQDLIGGLVKSLKGTYVESNTAYGGSRNETAKHYQVAEDHGFTPIVIMDEEESMELAVNGGEVLQGVNYVGARFAEFDSMLVLSHFKGHQMAGFGGAVKNISIGISSSEGKVWIHSGGKRTSGGISGGTDEFQMAMAEAGLSISDAMGGGEDIVYINVMNRLSVDCDCNGHPAQPDIHDIGILASRDPVALDKACLDLIWKAEGNERFVLRVEGRQGFRALEYGEEIGLGKMDYELVDING
jgi:uncharacterized Fe-S center protein